MGANSGFLERDETATERARRSRWVVGERAAARQMERMWSEESAGEERRRESAARDFWYEVRMAEGSEGLRMAAAEVDSRRRTRW